MDITFKCSACEQELEVDAAGAGSEIECPACGATITIPTPAEPPTAAASLNPIASSAAAKEEKHFKVPTHTGKVEALIKKPTKPLEVAAKEDSDRKLRIKTIKRSECQEFGKDKFDEIVSQTFQDIGEQHITGVHVLSYSHIDPVSQKLVNDYGVMIVFKG